MDTLGYRLYFYSKYKSDNWLDSACNARIGMLLKCEFM